LKYLRTHPVEKLTIAGGVAKMTKLAQGMLDVHSKRGLADLDALAKLSTEAGGDETLADAIRHANTVSHAFTMAGSAGIDLGSVVAEKAWKTAADALNTPETALEILVFDRDGALKGRHGFAPSHHVSAFPSGERNRRT
jgi:cobalt-precorrin-5B (C1)-methyltransferase